VRPGRAADHSPPSSAAVMEEYSYTCTHPLGHTGPVTGSLYLYLFNISLRFYLPTQVSIIIVLHFALMIYACHAIYDSGRLIFHFGST